MPFWNPIYLVLQISLICYSSNPAKEGREVYVLFCSRQEIRYKCKCKHHNYSFIRSKHACQEELVCASDMPGSRVRKRELTQRRNGDLKEIWVHQKQGSSLWCSSDFGGPVTARVDFGLEPWFFALENQPQALILLDVETPGRFWRPQSVWASMPLWMHFPLKCLSLLLTWWTSPHPSFPSFPHPSSLTSSNESSCLLLTSNSRLCR